MADSREVLGQPSETNAFIQLPTVELDLTRQLDQWRSTVGLPESIASNPVGVNQWYAGSEGSLGVLGLGAASFWSLFDGSRRSFLRLAGAGGIGLGLTYLAACAGRGSLPETPQGISATPTVDIDPKLLTSLQKDVSFVDNQSWAKLNFGPQLAALSFQFGSERVKAMRMDVSEGLGPSNEFLGYTFDIAEGNKKYMYFGADPTGSGGAFVAVPDSAFIEKKNGIEVAFPINQNQDRFVHKYVDQYGNYLDPRMGMVVGVGAGVTVSAEEINKFLGEMAPQLRNFVKDEVLGKNDDHAQFHFKVKYDPDKVGGDLFGIFEELNGNGNTSIYVVSRSSGIHKLDQVQGYTYHLNRQSGEIELYQSGRLAGEVQSVTSTGQVKPEIFPIATVVVTPSPEPTAATVPIPEKEDRLTAIRPFINAMKMAGIEITEQTEEQVDRGLSIQEFTDVEGNPFFVYVTSNTGNPFFDGKPLIMLEEQSNGEVKWKEAKRGKLGTKKGVPIGVYVLEWKAYDGNKQYEAILLNDTNHFQLDDLGIWSSLEPEEGKINKVGFEKLKYAATLAKRNGYTLSAGSGIIWGHPDWGIPAWLKTKRYSQEELLSLAESHIETFLTPFKDDLRRVSVANEVLRHLLGISNFWIDTKGIDRKTLLKRSFHKARQVVPDAELALREYSIEFEGYPRSEEFFNLVMELNDEEMAENGRNLIDAVEFQLPLLLDVLIGKDPAMNPENFNNPEKRSEMIEKLRSNIRRFKEKGINVYIVELMLPIDRLSGSTIGEKLILQGQIYADIYRVCVEEGIGVGLTSTNNNTGLYDAYPDPKTNTLPYPRNEKYEPLPAYYAINGAILFSNRTA